MKSTADELIQRRPSGRTGVEPAGYYGDRSHTRKPEHRHDRYLKGHRRRGADPQNAPPDLSDFLAVRFRPWWLILWEPLRIKVPGPNLARPYCCYMDTIIFYARPYQKIPPTRYLSSIEIDGNTTRHLPRPVIQRNSTGEFAEYGRVSHALVFDHHVRFEGELWHVERAGVRWTRRDHSDVLALIAFTGDSPAIYRKPEPKAWWMRYWARRARPDARCAFCAEHAEAIYRCSECGELSFWDEIENGICPHCGSANLRPATVASYG